MCWKKDAEDGTTRQKRFKATVREDMQMVRVQGEMETDDLLGAAKGRTTVEIGSRKGRKADMKVQSRITISHVC